MINVGQLTTFTPVPQAALSLLLSRLDHDVPARPPTLEPNTNSYKKRGCSCARLGISCSINNQGLGSMLGRRTLSVERPGAVTRRRSPAYARATSHDPVVISTFSSTAVL
jgi:hypothetical protein